MSAQSSTPAPARAGNKSKSKKDNHPLVFNGFTVDTDMRKQMEDLVSRVPIPIYLIKPLGIWQWRLPAFVSACHPPNIIPFYQRYRFEVETVPYEDKFIDYLNVKQENFSFGKKTSISEFLIEPDLVIGCFAQSTVTDYDTLINRIFLTVARGRVNGVPKKCADTLSKLEAIVAMYMFTHPNGEGAAGSIVKMLSEYRPMVEGVYALGGEAPPQGDPKCQYTFKDPIAYWKTWYVARQLIPLPNITPQFIPRRDFPEYEKAIAKRLNQPDIIRYTNSIGIKFDDRKLEQVITEAVHRFLNHTMPRARSVEVSDPQAIMDCCLQHARQKFTSQYDIDAYMEGADIAINHDIGSPEFQWCVTHATLVSAFPKDEGYDEPKPIRFVMCPEKVVRGFCHALLMPAQEALFGTDEQTANPWCVKHLTEEQKSELIKKRCEGKKVINTDYSSLESSIRAMMMRLIEQPIFMELSPPPLKEKVRVLFERYISGPYIVNSKNVRIELPPMRLSGQEHTSAGNWLINCVWMISMVKMIIDEWIDLDLWMPLFEGDDGIMQAGIPVIYNRGDYTMTKEVEIDPEDFSKAASGLGARLKIGVFTDYTQASFCGVKLAPGIHPIDGPGDYLDIDEHRVLAKIIWMIDYDPTTAKHDREYLYARCLSWLPRVVANSKLYAAVFYLAYTNQPSYRQSRSNAFKLIWNKTFYKGDAKDYFQVDTPWELKKYCEKFRLPWYIVDEKQMPELLTRTYDMPDPSMSIVQLDDLRSYDSWLSRLKHFFIPYMVIQEESPIEGRYILATDYVDDWCYAHSIHEYLRMTDQCDVDFAEFMKRTGLDVHSQADRQKQKLVDFLLMLPEVTVSIDADVILVAEVLANRGQNAILPMTKILKMQDYIYEYKLGRGQIKELHRFKKSSEYYECKGFVHVDFGGFASTVGHARLAVLQEEWNKYKEEERAQKTLHSMVDRFRQPVRGGESFLMIYIAGVICFVGLYIWWIYQQLHARVEPISGKGTVRVAALSEVMLWLFGLVGNREAAEAVAVHAATTSMLGVALKYGISILITVISLGMFGDKIKDGFEWIIAWIIQGLGFVFSIISALFNKLPRSVAHVLLFALFVAVNVLWILYF